MDKTEDNLFAQGNKKKSEEGNNYQNKKFDNVIYLLEELGLYKDIDFNITNNESLYIYIEKYNSLLGIDNLNSTLKLVSCIEELYASLSDKQNFEIFKNDMIDLCLDNLNELKEFFVEHSNCDIKLHLFRLPNIIFVFEIMKSSRKDRVNGKRTQAQDIVKCLEYMGFEVVYVLVAPKNEELKNENTKTEIRDIELQFKRINREYSNKKADDIKEYINIAIQDDYLKDFLSFISFTNLTTAKDIIKEYKKSRELKIYNN